jgi:hypothetical protein
MGKPMSQAKTRAEVEHLFDLLSQIGTGTGETQLQPRKPRRKKLRRPKQRTYQPLNPALERSTKPAIAPKNNS